MFRRSLITGLGNNKFLEIQPRTRKTDKDSNDIVLLADVGSFKLLFNLRCRFIFFSRNITCLDYFKDILCYLMCYLMLGNLSFDGYQEFFEFQLVTCGMI